jgi:Holliday junction resolvasome RuvABC endonuclease subunit
MKKLIAFDISSTTIGWSLFFIDEENKTAQLSEYGYIKPPKGTEKKPLSLTERLRQTYNLIEQLIKKYNPDFAVAEDYVKGFTSKRSTANTIIMLSVFNEIVCLSIFDHSKIIATKYAVITIRSIISKFLNIRVIEKL